MWLSCRCGGGASSALSFSGISCSIHSAFGFSLSSLFFLLYSSSSFIPFCLSFLSFAILLLPTPVPWPRGGGVMFPTMIMKNLFPFHFSSLAPPVPFLVPSQQQTFHLWKFRVFVSSLNTTLSSGVIAEVLTAASTSWKSTELLYFFIVNH